MFPPHVGLYGSGSRHLHLGGGEIISYPLRESTAALAAGTVSGAKNDELPAQDRFGNQCGSWPAWAREAAWRDVALAVVRGHAILAVRGRSN